MAQKGPKGKKNPQKQRKSARNKKRSEKGEYYDEFILQDTRSAQDIITAKVDAVRTGESMDTAKDTTQSTPEPIVVPTPRRESTSRSRDLEGTDLLTELTVAEAVDVMVDTVEERRTDFPNSVVSVNNEVVKEIHFQLDQKAQNQTYEVDPLLSNIYDLYYQSSFKFKIEHLL